MKIFFMVMIIVLSCFSCGKKGSLEYKSFYYKNSITKIIL